MLPRKQRNRRYVCRCAEDPSEFEEPSDKTEAHDENSKEIARFWLKHSKSSKLVAKMKEDVSNLHDKLGKNNQQYNAHRNEMGKATLKLAMLSAQQLGDAHRHQEKMLLEENVVRYKDIVEQLGRTQVSSTP